MNNKFFRLNFLNKKKYFGDNFSPCLSSHLQQQYDSVGVWFDVCEHNYACLWGNFEQMNKREK